MGKDLNRKGVFPVVRILRLRRTDGEVRPVGIPFGPLVKPGLQ